MVVRAEAVVWVIAVDVPSCGFQFVRRSTIGGFAVVAFDVPVERAVVPASAASLSASSSVAQ